jgi:hypothetical protein
MTIRNKVCIGLAVFHLLIVTLGASHTDFSSLGVIGKALSTYALISGADVSYAFFAPGIFGQLRAQFDVIDQDGKVKPVPLRLHESHEAELRVGNIIDQMQADREDQEDFQRAMTASLARNIFARYPGAHAVVVRLEEFSPVSIEEFRKNFRPSWTPLYEAKYTRNASL